MHSNSTDFIEDISLNSKKTEEYMLLSQAPKYMPGITSYRLRLLCKEGKIRHLMVGNRYIVKLSWVIEDLEKMAEENLRKLEEQKPVYGQLRKIKA